MLPIAAGIVGTYTENTRKSPHRILTPIEGILPLPALRNRQAIKAIQPGSKLPLLISARIIRGGSGGVRMGALGVCRLY
jgi:hypothetical protein